MSMGEELSLSRRAQNNRNYLKLPPQLKQEHGDGVIMCADEDSHLQNKLLSLISHVGSLQDGNPPSVVPLDEACPWVQSIIDNVEKSMEYYTLFFCIISEHLLKTRYFADAAFLEILEKNKSTFIPVFENSETLDRMKSSPEVDDKLPALYRSVKPLFLYINSTRSPHTKMVTQLKGLFNCHLDAKLTRIDNQETNIKEALDKMDKENEFNNQYSTSSSLFPEPHSMSQSVSTLSENNNNDITDSYSQTDHLIICQTALEASQITTAADNAALDLSVDGDLEITQGDLPEDITDKEEIPYVLQSNERPTAVNNMTSMQKDTSSNTSMDSHYKTLVQVNNRTNTDMCFEYVHHNDVQENSHQFHVQFEVPSELTNFAANCENYVQRSNIRKNDENDNNALCSSNGEPSIVLQADGVNNNANNSILEGFIDSLGYITVGVALGAAAMYCVTKYK